MSESNPTPETAPVAGARILAILGGCLIFGLLVQTLLARIDRTHVDQLEAFSESTAVGDHVHYPLPSPLPNPPTMVARVRGEALVPVSYEKVERRDTKMEPFARDSATKLTIYQNREQKPGEDKFYFVKTASNEYLKLRAEK